jgi:hypothetical protein
MFNASAPRASQEGAASKLRAAQSALEYAGIPACTWIADQIRIALGHYGHQDWDGAVHVADLVLAHKPVPGVDRPLRQPEGTAMANDLRADFKKAGIELGWDSPGAD